MGNPAGLDVDQQFMETLFCGGPLELSLMEENKDNHRLHRLHRLKINEKYLRTSTMHKTPTQWPVKMTLCLLIAALACPRCMGNDLATWYDFKPQNTPEPGEIGMQAWLETPAGKHGRIHSKQDALVYNNRPIQLWGINLCYSTCAPDKDLADRRAAF